MKPKKYIDLIETKTIRKFAWNDFFAVFTLFSVIEMIILLFFRLENQFIIWLGVELITVLFWFAAIFSDSPIAYKRVRKTYEVNYHD
jgi:hypothetical protein